MLRAITPSSLRAPFARYSHGIEVPDGARLVFCSGQLGIGADEVIPEGSEAQARLILRWVWLAPSLPVKTSSTGRGQRTRCQCCL